MTISYVGGASNAGAGNATISVSLTALTGGSDSAPIEGDLVIHVTGLGDADGVDGDITMNTAGYTEVADLYAGASAVNEANLGVFYKFMGPTPDTTSVSNNPLGNDTGLSAAVMVFRGVKTVADGGPFDVTSTTATGIGIPNNPDPPSIDTTGVAGIWTVIAGVTAHIRGTTTMTGPTNYTVDFISAPVGNDTTDATTGMGYRTDPGDPEDPGVITFSGTPLADFSWCAITMALAEAGAAVPTAPGVGRMHVRGIATAVKIGIASALGRIKLRGTAAGFAIKSAAGVGRLHVRGTAAGRPFASVSAVGRMHVRSTAAGFKIGLGSAVGRMHVRGTATGGELVSVPTAAGIGRFHVRGTATGFKIGLGSGVGRFHFRGTGQGIQILTASAHGRMHVRGTASGGEFLFQTAAGIGRMHFRGAAIGEPFIEPPGPEMVVYRLWDRRTPGSLGPARPFPGDRWRRIRKV